MPQTSADDATKGFLSTIAVFRYRSICAAIAGSRIRLITLMELARKQSFLLFMSLIRQDIIMNTSCSDGSNSLAMRYTMRRKRELGHWNNLVTSKKSRVSSSGVNFSPCCKRYKTRVRRPMHFSGSRGVSLKQRADCITAALSWLAHGLLNSFSSPFKFSFSAVVIFSFSLSLKIWAAVWAFIVPAQGPLPKAHLAQTVWVGTGNPHTA
mmetsp:Transcript_139703/g.243240  ORF Transcript_139703/g.243240 Transcript_139703/m.243240 type:complete len:209 (-) Transcript_139703:1-627(-)